MEKIFFTEASACVIEILADGRLFALAKVDNTVVEPVIVKIIMTDETMAILFFNGTSPHFLSLRRERRKEGYMVRISNTVMIHYTTFEFVCDANALHVFSLQAPIQILRVSQRQQSEEGSPELTTKLNGQAAITKELQRRTPQQRLRYAFFVSRRNVYPETKKAKANHLQDSKPQRIYVVQNTLVPWTKSLS